jgi:hypothetical protein
MKPWTKSWSPFNGHPPHEVVSPRHFRKDDLRKK